MRMGDDAEGVSGGAWFSAFEHRGPRFETVPLEVHPASQDGGACVKIGGWFKAGDGPAGPEHLRVIGPYHGRSAITRWGKSWVAIKGVGWTWARPAIMRSRKDQELTFGLLGFSDAYREVQVSGLLGEGGGTFATVLGMATLPELIVEGAVEGRSMDRWEGGGTESSLHCAAGSGSRGRPLLFLRCGGGGCGGSSL